MGFVMGLSRFMPVRKRFYLVSVLVVTVVFGGLVVFKGSAVGPFLHTVF
jgi:hypothetical protein